MDNKYTLNEQDFIGEVDVLLSEVVTARGGALTKELKYRRPQLLQRRRGYLTLSAEEWHTEKAADTLSFVVRGTRLRANGKVFFTVLRTLARNTYGYVELHARAACALCPCSSRVTRRARSWRVGSRGSGGGGDSGGCRRRAA